LKPNFAIFNLGVHAEQVRYKDRKIFAVDRGCLEAFRRNYRVWWTDKWTDRHSLSKCRA